MSLSQKDRRLFVTTAILVIVNLVGFIGIHSTYQALFLTLTPFSLLLSTILLFINYDKFSSKFIFFCLAVFLSGFLVEVVGVKTGVIFGEYKYGNTLGFKLFDIPLMIGVNWLMLICFAGSIFSGLKTNIVIKSFLGAGLLVFLDFFIEPVAMNYDFWAWNNSIIPLQNYIAWFILSFVLLLGFNRFDFKKNNRFAIILFINQFLFFYFNREGLVLEMKHYTYSFLLIATLAYPILQSFEHRLEFYKTWKYLFPAILITSVIFIAGDVWFVNIGIWKFNPDYVVGKIFFDLPFEEWLFFIVIPFACVFIYEVLHYFIKKDILASQSKYITLFLSFALIIVSFIYYNKMYTFSTFLLLGIFLLIHQFLLKSTYLGRFYITWLVCLLPFFLVNGVLTAMPVLIYNNSQMLGIRLYTIPLEDVFYGMLQILLVVTLYEEFKKRMNLKKQK